MTDSYRGGYKKALLDVKNAVETDDIFDKVRSKQQTRKLITSLLDVLLQDGLQLDIFMDTGGYCAYAISPDNKVKYVK